jgi:hypothetical protein
VCESQTPCFVQCKAALCCYSVLSERSLASKYNNSGVFFIIIFILYWFSRCCFGLKIIPVTES